MDADDPHIRLPTDDPADGPAPGTHAAGRFELCFDEAPPLALRDLKGIGPKTIERLAERGIMEPADLLLFFPRAYRRIYRFVPGPELRELQASYAEFYGQVVDVRDPGARSRAPIQVTVDADGQRFQLVWFRAPHRGFSEQFRRGRSVRVEGAIDYDRGLPQLSHPTVRVEEPRRRARRITLQPIYVSFEGVSDTILRAGVEQAAEALLPYACEILPADLRRAYDFPTVRAALETIHLLGDAEVDVEAFEAEVARARERLVYEEFYTLQLGLAQRYVAHRRAARAPRCREHELSQRFRDSLPFELTGDQREAVATITEEMGGRVPMQRLLQGDVGSGKTVVAFMAAAVAIGSGCQACLMAPTDVLAHQHLRRAREFFASLPVRIAGLTGSLTDAQKREVLGRLRRGEVDLIIGTHALFQPDVIFAGGDADGGGEDDDGAAARLQGDLLALAAPPSPPTPTAAPARGLGLVIVDEQHKFGVEQREALLAKGRDPHLLAMTATPIPRSLAHAFFGDLDLTVIREKPPGRKPIRTFLRDVSAAPKVLAYVRGRVEKGEQAYVVYPLVEPSDAAPHRPSVVAGAEALASGALSGQRVGVLHGRMSSEEKDAVMTRFSRGEIDVLCATTVVEVGVDVANATLMVIQGAEVFGLSQLHQLRGRIGRGSTDSVCVLLASERLTPEAEQRLRSFVATEDGFELAEVDLVMRGPGQFLGSRQSGMAEFRFGDLVRDADVLARARRDARRMVFGDAGG